jgi:hypothetical protein
MKEAIMNEDNFKHDEERWLSLIKNLHSTAADKWGGGEPRSSFLQAEGELMEALRNFFWNPGGSKHFSVERMRTKAMRVATPNPKRRDELADSTNEKHIRQLAQWENVAEERLRQLREQVPLNGSKNLNISKFANRRTIQRVDELLSDTFDDMLMIVTREIANIGPAWLNNKKQSGTTSQDVIQLLPVKRQFVAKCWDIWQTQVKSAVRRLCPMRKLKTDDASIDDDEACNVERVLEPEICPDLKPLAEHTIHLHEKDKYRLEKLPQNMLSLCMSRVIDQLSALPTEGKDGNDGRSRLVVEFCKYIGKDLGSIKDEQESYKGWVKRLRKAMNVHRSMHRDEIKRIQIKIVGECVERHEEYELSIEDFVNGERLYPPRPRGGKKGGHHAL